jgi:hypothetical protein
MRITNTLLAITAILLLVASIYFNTGSYNIQLHEQATKGETDV